MALDGADRARLIPISHVAYAGHQVRADSPRRLRLEYVDVCGYEGRATACNRIRTFNESNPDYNQLVHLIVEPVACGIIPRPRRYC
jgi:hypothetical protein